MVYSDPLLERANNVGQQCGQQLSIEFARDLAKTADVLFEISLRKFNKDDQAWEAYLRAGCLLSQRAAELNPGITNDE